ncbi:MAG: hypothetical protein ACREMB_19795, partial [Candidatus Rokuibacteriota bacterium]
PQGGAQDVGPPPQGSQASGQSAPRNCETVTVEGHYETRVMPSGQRVTTWVPAEARQICQ